jgi:antitoxin CptB
MTDNSAHNRVFWHSRRGMLELDLALMPFVREVYPQLSEADQAIYRRLLECEDTELFDWVLQKGRPEDQELASIMDKIITYAKTPKN